MNILSLLNRHTERLQALSNPLNFALYRSKLTFSPNPITPYCFSNAVLDEDRNMNKKPVKKTHNAKIDSTITNLMTFYLFNNMEV